MSLHKLTAGSGYDYLTRHVAAHDATGIGHTTLASYYSEKGEVPGVWIGSGLAGIDGLEVGDVVTAEQMRALFAFGFHPLADERLAALDGDPSESEVRSARHLGTPFKVYKADVPEFVVEVARRIEDLNTAAGQPRDAVVDLEVRARIRSEVARESFEREHGRPPASVRELAATVAKLSRPKTTAVAGYDLTFSPVKSVSALWAVADSHTAAKIELAHQAAVGDALKFLEKEALYTRTGARGVMQVDVAGLVGTAFTHRDSRSGDPDLHTHVAVANKVQALDGNWLAIDGRVLFKANVSASETYNTALENHLFESLGIRFTERHGTDRRKRPVREIVGVEPALSGVWSSRRASIEVRSAKLVTEFQALHGRTPTPSESIDLAQQATLETREAKHQPRSLAEQRQAWRAQATNVLGDTGAVDQMVTGALSPDCAPRIPVTADWVERTATNVVSVVQSKRSTWQAWHLRAEVERQTRGVDVSTDRVEALVSLIIDESIQKSVPLATDRDLIRDPKGLRRIDGASVFHVAGSDLFTSQAVLDAEQRIINAGGEFDGCKISAEDVDLALLESVTNDVELNTGQQNLVRQMATSGARLQLGIAAAGTGKTTALGVLTRAWENQGGNVLGLAPSATAATQLRNNIGTTTDTLAKLVHTIQTNRFDQMPGRIGPQTLVLIDEAGLADTLSLDRAISYVLKQGASVRLIGDDQQLAAIGAGGVLRDIATRHGVVRLGELMRFEDSSEGAASLALRDGLTEGIGHYLDRDRVHASDLATATEDVFNRWAADRKRGLDSIMLAPTRDLVCELNARARTARLAEQPDPGGRTVWLSDGSQASVGDIVITRHNDRRLRVSATDWVKNGDRWHVTGVDEGRLQVRHIGSGLRRLIPASYVAEYTELGYASTVHTAQGISTDTMHGLVTGGETRQQFYTMMTRARHENHAYVVTATDGDPHNLIRPETIHPTTAVDVLEQILGRDGSPRSATTIAREANSPQTLLSQAATRFVATLYAGAKDLIGDTRVALIDTQAELLVPGIGDEPAWPTLRSHLHLLEAQGNNSLDELARAVTERELDGAQDRAAILDWRLDPTGRRGGRVGPLPWLAAIPDSLATDPKWGEPLAERAFEVQRLAQTVRDDALACESPRWTRHGAFRLDDRTLGDVAVWRAANSIDDGDRRPTGAPQLQKATATYQRRLDEHVNAGRTPALVEWGSAIDAIAPHRDAFTGLLAERLAALNRAGLNAASLLRGAISEGPLPDDHVCAAIWWRINRHLSPAVAVEATGHDTKMTIAWAELLERSLGERVADDVMRSSYWPTLVASIERATHLGWTVPDLLDSAANNVADGVDQAQALMWHIAIHTDPTPERDRAVFEPPPADLDDALPPFNAFEDRDGQAESIPERLSRAAFERELLEPLSPSESDIARTLEQAYEWDHSPVTGDRILAINELATNFYERQLQTSWAQNYLRARLGQDLSGDERFRPGYAPHDWTGLIDHLRSLGVRDDELLAAGLAKTASTGQLIDRFRDRVMFPVIHEGSVLGFIGRRHPDADDHQKSGPKYLNTTDTIVFHKGAQLFGLAEHDMAAGSVPVLVEGPMDAIAVTLATAGSFIGVAPLGTSLTADQAAELAGLDAAPIIATDGDLAGRIAAERDYWLLTPHNLDPRYATFRNGADPASLLSDSGPAALVLALQQSTALADSLVSDRSEYLEIGTERLVAVADVIASRPPEKWTDSAASAAHQCDFTPETLAEKVADAAFEINNDRAKFVAAKVAATSKIGGFMEKLRTAPPAERWSRLAREIDTRLLDQRDWPATASMIQEVHDSGRNAPDLVRQVALQHPLGNLPAQDLRYRLVGYLQHNYGSNPEAASDHMPAGPNLPPRGPALRPKRPDVSPPR